MKYYRICLGVICLLLTGCIPGGAQLLSDRQMQTAVAATLVAANPEMAADLIGASMPPTWTPIYRPETETPTLAPTRTPTPVRSPTPTSTPTDTPTPTRVMLAFEGEGDADLPSLMLSAVRLKITWRYEGGEDEAEMLRILGVRHEKALGMFYEDYRIEMERLSQLVTDSTGRRDSSEAQRIQDQITRVKIEYRSKVRREKADYQLRKAALLTRFSLKLNRPGAKPNQAQVLVDTRGEGKGELYYRLTELDEYIFYIDAEGKWFIEIEETT